MHENHHAVYLWDIKPSVQYRLLMWWTAPASGIEVP
jgi:hypothetical protein